MAWFSVHWFQAQQFKKKLILIIYRVLGFQILCLLSSYSSWTAALNTHTTVRLASTSSPLNGSFDFSPCHVVFDHSSPQRMCDPQQSGIFSSRAHHHYSTNKRCLYITFSGCTRSPSVRWGYGTSPEALPLRGNYGKQRAQRALPAGATEPGGPRPGRPGRHRGPRSRERRPGQRGPRRAGKGGEGGAGRAVAGPGTGSAPRVSLSSAPAAALPQPPPSCRSPPTPRVRGHGPRNWALALRPGRASGVRLGTEATAAGRNERKKEGKKKKRKNKIIQTPGERSRRVPVRRRRGSRRRGPGLARREGAAGHESKVPSLL